MNLSKVFLLAITCVLGILFSAPAQSEETTIATSQDFDVLVHVHRPKNADGDVIPSLESQFAEYAQIAVEGLREKLPATEIMDAERRAKFFISLRVSPDCVMTQVYAVTGRIDDDLEENKYKCTSGLSSKPLSEEKKIRFIKQIIRQQAREIPKHLNKVDEHRSIVDVALYFQQVPLISGMNTEKMIPVYARSISHDGHFEQIFRDYFTYVGSAVPSQLDFIEKSEFNPHGRYSEFPNTSPWESIGSFGDLYWRMFQTRRSSEEFLPAIERLLDVHSANLIGEEHVVFRAIMTDATPEAIDAILDRVDDTNSLKTRAGYSLLSFAADARVNEKYRTDLIVKALEGGADINSFEHTVLPPVFTAAAQVGGFEAYELLDYVLYQGGDTSLIQPDWGISTLHPAIGVNKTHGDPEKFDSILAELLKRGFSVNVPTDAPENAITPLMSAIVFEHDVAVKALLQNGANPNTGFTENLQSEFEKAGYQPAEAFTLTTSALNLLIYKGKNELIDAILNAGIDLEYRDAFGRSALQAAISANNESAAFDLIDRGFVVESADVDGFIYLNEAMNKGMKRFSAALVDRGVDVNSIDSKGRTPLFYAYPADGAEMTDVDFALIKSLLDAGADAEFKDYTGLSASERYQQQRRILLDRQQAERIAEARRLEEERRLAAERERQQRLERERQARIAEQQRYQRSTQSNDWMSAAASFLQGVTYGLNEYNAAEARSRAAAERARREAFLRQQNSRSSSISSTGPITIGVSYDDPVQQRAATPAPATSAPVQAQTPPPIERRPTCTEVEGRPCAYVTPE